MSLGSFAASLSGLHANQQKLSVIGNNLANINTVAFKASNVAFADLVSQSIGGSGANPMQIGLGVSVGEINPIFSQGGIESTGVTTNVAIQGPGFFLLGDSANRTYSRAGNFSFNSEGALVSADGRIVQGYTATDPVTRQIVVTGQPSDIRIPPGVLRAPVATTQIGMTANLDANAVAGTKFNASVELYDSLGVPHVATTTFTKTAAGAWSYSVTVPGAEVTGGTAGTPFQIATGTLQFNSQGKLSQVNGGAVADVTIAGPAWANGSATVGFNWDLVDANGLGAITGYSATSATSSVNQNGTATGVAAGLVSIDQAGELIASFGVGETVVVGQLALATFNDPQGLVKSGTNLFAQSERSGSPSVGVAGTGSRGTLVGSALEQSNVDIAQEFTQMILAQRGYQANSKSITVSDELIQETLNLKR